MLVAFCTQLDVWRPLVDRANDTNLIRLEYDIRQCQLITEHPITARRNSVFRVTREGITPEERANRHALSKCLAKRHHPVLD